MPSQEQAAPSPAPGRRSGLFRRFVVSYCLLLVVLWVPLFVLADVRMSEGLRDQAREARPLDRPQPGGALPAFARDLQHAWR